MNEDQPIPCDACGTGFMELLWHSRGSWFCSEQCMRDFTRNPLKYSAANP